MLLHQILASDLAKKTLKKSCKNNKFKISAPTSNAEERWTYWGLKFISSIPSETWKSYWSSPDSNIR